MDDSAFQVFEKWKRENPHLIHFISIQTPSRVLSSQADVRVFATKRAGIHERYCDRLREMAILIAKELGNVFDEIANIRQTRVPEIQGLVFDRQADNMSLRKVGFARRKGMKMLHKFYLNRSKQLKLKIEKVQSLLEFYHSGIIPPLLVISIVESFFQLPLINTAQLNRIKLLSLWRERLFRKLSDARRQPAWSQNFLEFFDKLVNDGVKVMDPDTFYFRPVPREVSFSRYLFTAASKHGRLIDAFIEKTSVSSFADFAPTVIDLCCSLLPKSYQAATQRHSAALLIYYRAIMDRVYELHPNLIRIQESTFSKSHSMLAQRDVELYTLPATMIPKHEPGVSVRDVMLSNEHFRDAAAHITCSAFAVNSIDSLWWLHDAMAKIHRAAITISLGRNPTYEEVQRLLDFDDLFSLVVATIIASDIPDAYQQHEFTKQFAPHLSFSPVLEYTGANLEAFIAFCEREIVK